MVTEPRDVTCRVAKVNLSFDAEVWEYTGEAAWHFVSVPEEHTDDIRAAAGLRARGFGSVRVEVTIGATRWTTSVFPDSKSGGYVLPVKKDVRAAEGLVAGATTHVRMVVVGS